MRPSVIMLDKSIPNEIKFGTWLKKSREEQDISVRELADMLDRSPTHISYIERGKRNPSPDDMDLLTQIFPQPEQELPYLADLIGCAKENWKDINETLGADRDMRNFMHLASKEDWSEEEFLKNFLMVLDDAQRKDLIDEILYLVGEDEKDSCLEWLSSMLTEKQIDAYIALSNQEEPEPNQN